MKDQNPQDDAPASAQAPVTLTDDALDTASGGIIAILIGAVDKKIPGDGSVRPQISDGTSNTIIDGTSNTIVRR